MADSIWFETPSLESLNSTRQDTLSGVLGIEYSDIGPDFLRATMPVNNTTRQPYGILHGGASVTLAESLGSIGAFLVLNPATHYPVGLDINANHIRSVREGMVIGTATPAHLGRTTHVWEIQIHNEANQLTCISRLTVAILARS